MYEISPKHYSFPHERGAVLILVLILMAGLSVLAMEFTKDSLRDHALSSSLKSVVLADVLGESIERIASDYLVKSYIRGRLNCADEIKSNFYKIIADISRELKTGDISCLIEDENSLFPLNSIFYSRPSEKKRAEAYTQILERLIAHLLYIHGYRPESQKLESISKKIVAYILQWGGGQKINQESLYWYLAQVPKKIPPQRPLQSPEELLLVRWPPEVEFLKTQVMFGKEELPGLIKNLTFWSRGPMNINTLRIDVLRALVPEISLGEEFAQVIQLRRRDGAICENVAWYERIFTKYGIVGIPVGVIDTSSRWYRLQADIAIGARESRFIAIGWVTYDSMIWEYRTIQ
jgi:type II secretory pathway component PulK